MGYKTLKLADCDATKQSPANPRWQACKEVGLK
jgi:hypothetical protein